MIRNGPKMATRGELSSSRLRYRPKTNPERGTERDTDPDPDGILSDGEHDRPDDYPDGCTKTGGHSEITGFVAVFW